MKRKVLSALICTAMAVSQASMIPTIANADSTGDSSTATGSSTATESTTGTAVTVGDSTTSAAVSVSSTTSAAVTAVNWNSTVFGTTTSASNNTINVDEANNTVTVTAGSKDGSKTGGKVTGAQDGMSYYYTEIDPSKNFELSADVKVNYFEKTNPDNQAGFGIMARDTIGAANDTSTSNSNMCLVGGYRSAVESVFRNGITKDSSGQVVATGATMEGEHKFSDRPANDGIATYKLKLKKTNTGYIASVDDGEEITYYRPKQLEVLDSSKIYLGFFAARVASITVSNINLTTSDVATDPAGVAEPEAVITPALDVTSTTASGASIYNLDLEASVAGNVNVKQDGNQIYNDTIKADTTLAIPLTLVSGDNIFNITYTPSQANATPINKTYTVTYKTYGVENGDVYVSSTGSANGKGTEDDPIDIYSAIKYTGNGQTIKVKGGVYNLTAPIVIAKDNSGSADKVKTLTSYDGQRAVFNFGKKSAGLTLWGNYWKLYGIDVTNTSDTQHGITVSGNNNILENIKTYKNGDTGLQISGNTTDTIEKWPSNNLILNCESYDNMDAAMNNADGFAVKISCGYNNVFRGCISHNNCDDGWDLYTKAENGKIGPVTIEDCIAYGNGTLTDTTVTSGDGNGFKLGGEGIAVTNTLKNSLAFNNNSIGIDSNSNPAIVVENSIAADNKKSNFGLDYYTNANLQFNLKDTISFRTAAGVSDSVPDMVLDDSNYFYDGQKTSNKSGTEITSSYFKSVEMPTKVEMDSEGNIIWPDYMNPVNSTATGGTTTGGTATDGTTTGGTVTSGTSTGSTTTSSSSSHHHHSSSSSSSSTSSTTSGSNTTSSTNTNTETTVEVKNKNEWKQNTDGTWSVINSNGKKATGWLKDTDGSWYYLNDNGVMKT
jgi:hypothetical protein